MARLYPPPAHAAVTDSEGPRVFSTVARLAETVEAMMRGIVVGSTRTRPPRSTRRTTSRCASISPVPVPTITARSRVGSPDCSRASRAARTASSDMRPMKRVSERSSPRSLGSSGSR